VNGTITLETFVEDPQNRVTSDACGVKLWIASDMYAGIPA